MATIKDLYNPLWRQRLRLASWRGVPFHVDQQGRLGGRRLVVHEYPKRDLPYTEDMGRTAIRYQVTGYVIQTVPRNARGGMLSDYDLARDSLIAALDTEGPATLVDPYAGRLFHLGYGDGEMIAHCERYIMSENRERGGFAQFEMVFVEAGVPGNASASQASASSVFADADKASAAVKESTNAWLRSFNQ